VKRFGDSGKNDRDARADINQRRLERVQKDRITGSKQKTWLGGFGHPGDLLYRMHRRELEIV
jgi:hypothetical protein